MNQESLASSPSLVSTRVVELKSMAITSPGPTCLTRANETPPSNVGKLVAETAEMPTVSLVAGLLRSKVKGISKPVIVGSLEGVVAWR